MAEIEIEIEIEKKTRCYPSDLTNPEWLLIQPLLPPVARRVRKPKLDMREMLNAIRYIIRSGGGRRMLPTNFGLWHTLTWWFRRLLRRLMVRMIYDVALMLDRERVGRDASPTGGALHILTVKARSAKARGYEANKKIR